MSATQVDAGTMWDLLEVQVLSRYMQEKCYHTNLCLQISRALSAQPHAEKQLRMLKQHNQALSTRLNKLTEAVAKLQAENEMLSNACKRAEANIVHVVRYRSLGLFCTKTNSVSTTTGSWHA